MDDKIIEVIGAQGAWALLSVALIFYILKAQEKRDIQQEQRESNYQEIIKNMSDKLNILSSLSDDVREIKSRVNKFDLK